MPATRATRDISIVVRPGIPEWPGDQPFTCGWTRRTDAGDPINLGHFTMSPHVGTHADAPLHVQPDGASSDAFPLDVFRGPATVVELPASLRARASRTTQQVGMDDLEPLLDGWPERLLVRTGESVAAGRFPDAWLTLTASCVETLCGRGLRLLGVDSPSVDPRENEGLEAHRALFAGGAYNLENLDLRGVPPGHYELIAYPLRLEGMDGAPVRAVLLEPAAPGRAR